MTSVRNARGPESDHDVMALDGEALALTPRRMRAAGEGRYVPTPLAAAPPGRWAKRSGSPPCRSGGGRPGERLGTAPARRPPAVRP
ncbi:hypothetical protein GCM10022222_16160 [Amycolatopsis ultiminotia]|uniref:Uncharacterized protein n=1 Tax=Amycolatopsis ultiminotia TaxID=543629 RepID=A0ABP6VEY9_9PSEU